jgi:hypothetical protein
VKEFLNFMVWICGFILIATGCIFLAKGGLILSILFMIFGLLCFKSFRQKIFGIKGSIRRPVENIEKYLGKNAIEYGMRNSNPDVTGDLPAIFYDPLDSESLKALSGHTIKYWITMADSLVRDAHIEADGQVQFFDEPFEVMGEKLMFPGDTSLGASKANIRECRCIVVYRTIK